MMAPAVWPWVRSIHRLGGSSVPFAAGYLVVWLAYSVAAAGVQTALRVPAALVPLVLIAAGAYQFAPLKRACLTHCRNPVGYFLSRWRSRPIGAFRMGLDHGAYCVGCCWALMATMLAAGLMSAWWMAALGGVAFAEQVAPRGDRLRLPLGLALVGAGVWGIV